MKHLLLFALALCLLLPSCSDDDSLPTPKRMIINSIEVNDVPIKNQDGDNWDSLTSPYLADMYWIIYNGSNEVDRTSKFEDVNANTDYLYPVGLTIEALDDTHSFDAYDDDGLLSPDFMGRFSLVPIQKYIETNGATEIDLSVPNFVNFDVTLKVSYEF